MHSLAPPADRTGEEGTSHGTGRPLDRAVQCHLSAHEGDEHFGLLAELGQYGTALWLRWHGSDVDVAVLPDCPVIGTGSGSGSGGDACCLFAGHVERHGWEDTPPQ